MISRLAQPVDILHIILELNLWGVCKSSSINYIGPHVADDPLPELVFTLFQRYGFVQT